MDILKILRMIRFNPKYYWKEILSLVLSFFVIYYFLKRYEINFSLNNKDGYFAIPWYIIKLIIWLFLFKVIFWITDNFLKHVNNLKVILRGWKYEYFHGDLYNKWLFHGSVKELSGLNDLDIFSCYSGCLLKNMYWKNFEISFKLNLDSKYLKKWGEEKIVAAGILFYAEDLENYCMVQIRVNENKNVKISPHIRRGGIFEELQSVNTDININLDTYIDTRMIVKNKWAILYLNNIKCFTWRVPDLTYPFGRKIDNREDLREGSYVYNVFFAGKMGMVGFRASFDERFKIKDLIIRKI
jgi:hypothetical protein